MAEMMIRLIADSPGYGGTDYATQVVVLMIMMKMMTAIFRVVSPSRKRLLGVDMRPNVFFNHFLLDFALV